MADASILVGFRKAPNVRQSVEVKGVRMRVSAWEYVTFDFVDSNWQQLSTLVNSNLLLCSRPSLMVSYDAFTSAQSVLTSDAGSEQTDKTVQKTQVSANGHLIITYANGSQTDVGLVTGAAGRGVQATVINGAGNLIIQYTDGTRVDLGRVVAPDINTILPLGTALQYFRGDRLLDVLTPASVGLPNVLNMAPADMPVSLLTQLALDMKLNSADLGEAGNAVPLDNNRKIDLRYFPESILGSLRYQGTWDANANDPVLPAASEDNKGIFYIVNVEGTTNLDGITKWMAGDWAISNGDKWAKLTDGLTVQTLNGLTGAITLADLHLDKVDNTRDMDKPVPTSVQNQLSILMNLMAGKADLQDGLLTKVTTSNNGLAIMLASADGTNLSWRINKAQYTFNAPSFSTTLDSAAISNQRYDLIYGDTLGTIHVIKGTESTTAALVPSLPSNCIQISTVYVEGAQPVVQLPDLSGYQHKSSVLDTLATFTLTPGTVVAMGLDGKQSILPFSDFGSKLIGMSDAPTLRDQLAGYFLRYDVAQALTSQQIAQVRTNLTITDLVRYTAQTLADAQQLQVRTNIGLDKVANVAPADLPIQTQVQSALDAINLALASKAGFPDGLLTPVDVTQVGLVVTIAVRTGSVIKWRIAGTTYTLNQASVQFTVTAAATSALRMDLIYADTTSTMKLRKGVEVTGGVVTEPTAPDNSIKITTVELEGSAPVVTQTDLSGYQTKSTILGNISALTLPANYVLAGDTAGSSVKAIPTTTYGLSLMAMADSATFLEGIRAGLATFTKATATVAGKSGLVPAPAAGQLTGFLKADGTWATPSNSTAIVSVTTPASEGTLVTTFTDLTTVGPTANIVCGVSGIIRITLGAACAAGVRVSFQLNAGTTVIMAADDTRSGYTASASTVSWEYVATGLTPGTTYTVTLKYRADTGLLSGLLSARAFSARFVTLLTM